MPIHAYELYVLASVVFAIMMFTATYYRSNYFISTTTTAICFCKSEMLMYIKEMPLVRTKVTY